ECDRSCLIKGREAEACQGCQPLARPTTLTRSASATEGPRAVLLLPPDVLAVPAARLRRRLRLGLGLAAQQPLRPRQGPRPLPGVPRHPGLRRRARLRRHLRQRAPPDGLRPDAVAEPDG